MSRRPTTPSPTEANEPGSRLGEILHARAGTGRGRVPEGEVSRPANQAQPRSSSRNTASSASSSSRKLPRPHAVSPRHRGCGIRELEAVRCRRTLSSNEIRPELGRIDPCDDQAAPAEYPGLRGEGRKLRLERIERRGGRRRRARCRRATTRLRPLGGRGDRRARRPRSACAPPRAASFLEGAGALRPHRPEHQAETWLSRRGSRLADASARGGGRCGPRTGTPVPVELDFGTRSSAKST